MEGPTILLAPREDANCSLCSELRELRPYGPGGAWVCFQCANKDQDAMRAAYLRRLNFGDARLGDNPDGLGGSA